MKYFITLIAIFFSTILEAQIPFYHLTNQDLKTTDNFGSSVAVSEQFVAVGADGLEDTGGVLVYKGSGSSWNLHSTLIHSQASFHDFAGNDIAMSENYIVAAAPANGASQLITNGKAYVYQLVDDQWIEDGVLSPAPGLDGYSFGLNVNIHEDNILVSSPRLTQHGAVLLYEKQNDEWVNTFDFTADAGTIGAFGVAFDMNDEWIAIGSLDVDLSPAEAGQRLLVHLYKKVGSEWIKNQIIEYEYQILQAQTHVKTIELSQDQLLIGNHRVFEDENEEGEVRTYLLEDGSWNLSQKFHPEGFELHELGRQVALGENFAMYGASKYDPNNNDTPHHLFIYNTQNKDEWRLLAEFEYDHSSSMSWIGFIIDINNYYGVASSQVDNNEHGDVYIYDLRRQVKNINLLEDEEVLVYPIPSAENLTIESHNHEITDYKIINHLGQLFMQENNLKHTKFELNISKLPAGNYWIKVNTPEGHLYRSFSKIN